MRTPPAGWCSLLLLLQLSRAARLPVEVPVTTPSKATEQDQDNETSIQNNASGLEVSRTTLPTSGRSWTVEEVTDHPNHPSSTTQGYSGVYISPPVTVLDDYTDRHSTRVVHDVLVVKDRRKQPSKYYQHTSHPEGVATALPFKESYSSYWQGTAIPGGYGQTHAVLINNHKPPSVSKRPLTYHTGPAVTSIHIYPAVSPTTGYPGAVSYPGTVSSVPLSVYDTVANTTIVHSNIITLAKPTPASQEADKEPLASSSESTPATTTEEEMPEWALEQQQASTTPATSQLNRPIESLPGLFTPIGNLLQRFPPGMMSVFQNIGRVMLVFPTAIAAFMLAALLFV